MARSKTATTKKKKPKAIASGNFEVNGKPGDRSRSTRQKHNEQKTHRQDMMIKYMHLKKA